MNSHRNVTTLLRQYSCFVLQPDGSTTFLNNWTIVISAVFVASICTDGENTFK